MDTILSKANDNVKFISGLNEKKFRNKNKAFYLEGVKVVNEILDKKKAIDIMFIAYSKSILVATNGGKELLERIEKEDVKALDFDSKIFEYMTDTVNPQGVLVVCKIPEYNLDEEIQKNTGNILVLDQVQDLGNLGTIIRSANAFDISLIICTLGTADVYSPKTLRSTMGGILNTSIVYVKDNVEMINTLKNNGYKVVTTSLQAKGGLEQITKEKYAFVMGNEANGVSNEIMDMSDMYVKIPMSDKIESLNVGVATSIILYEQYKNKNI